MYSEFDELIAGKQTGQPLIAAVGSSWLPNYAAVHQQLKALRQQRFVSIKKGQSETLRKINEMRVHPLGLFLDILGNSQKGGILGCFMSTSPRRELTI